jgi:hypothetical protein
MAIARKRTTNSGDFLKKLAAAPVVPIPDNVDIKLEAAELWPTFAGARAPADWAPHDLILLAKICNLEADIRKQQAVLDQTGYVVETKKGVPVSNPLNFIISELQRRQLSIMRMLSIGSPLTDNRGRANDARRKRDIGNVFDEDEGGLLADPHSPDE